MEYKRRGGGCEETMREKDRRCNRARGERSRSVCLYYDIASKTQSYQLQKWTEEITAFKVSPCLHVKLAQAMQTLTLLFSSSVSITWTLAAHSIFLVGLHRRVLTAVDLWIWHSQRFSAGARWRGTGWESGNRLHITTDTIFLSPQPQKPLLIEITQPQS